MADPGFPRRFAAGRRTGVLLRILRDGVLQAGDPITVGAPPTHGVTVADINAIYYGDSRDLGPLHRATELAAHWRDWADHRTIWHLDDGSSTSTVPPVGRRSDPRSRSPRRRTHR